MRLLVINRKVPMAYKANTFEEADFIARTDGLGVGTIEWAVKEYGRCDGNDYVIIPAEWKEVG